MTRAITVEQAKQMMQDSAVKKLEDTAKIYTNLTKQALEQQLIKQQQLQEQLDTVTEALAKRGQELDTFKQQKIGASEQELEDFHAMVARVTYDKVKSRLSPEMHEAAKKYLY